MKNEFLEKAETEFKSWFESYNADRSSPNVIQAALVIAAVTELKRFNDWLEDQSKYGGILRQVGDAASRTGHGR